MVTFESIAASNGNIVTTYALSPIPAGTLTLFAMYFTGGCGELLTTLSDQPVPADKPTGASDAAPTITNDVFDVITAVNNFNGNQDLPTNGSQGATSDYNTVEYCVRMTICSTILTAGGDCPIDNVVDFVEVDIDYKYRFVGTDIEISDFAVGADDPTDTTLSDDFGVTAWVCDASDFSTTDEVEVATAINICVEVEDTAATSVASIDSITMEPEYGSSVTFPSPTNVGCGVGADSCYASSVTLPPRFVLDNDGVADTRTVGGTLTATLVLDGRRVRRSLRLSRNLLRTELSEASFSFAVVPATRTQDDEPSANGRCANVFFLFRPFCWVIQYILALYKQWI